MSSKSQNILTTEPHTLLPRLEKMSGDGDRVFARDEEGDARRLSSTRKFLAIVLWAPFALLTSCASTGSVTHSEPPEDIWTWEGALDLLSGVELTGHSGSAQLISTTRTQGGGTEDIAEGTSDFGGWGIGLYGGPVRTGFYIRPRLGYSSVKVAIADFAAAENQVGDNGAWELGATCTSASGREVVCGQENTYDLAIRSAYLGAQAGYDKVWGDGWIRPHFGIGLSSNTLGYRHVVVDFADQHLTDSGFFWGPGLGFLMGGGVAFPDINLVLRVVFESEGYGEVRYARELEFRGAPEYDSLRETYFRPRRFVENGDLSVFKASFGVAYVF